MSFIRKTSPLPALEIGQILPAQIIALTYPVKSPKSSMYPEREQVQFKLQLDDGYRFNAWISYYVEPHEHSDLGRLSSTLIQTIKKDLNTVTDAINSLKEYGRLYVRYIGSKESRGINYPKFKVVCDRLPGTQTNLQNRSNGRTLTREQADAMIQWIEEKRHQP